MRYYISKRDVKESLREILSESVADSNQVIDFEKGEKAYNELQSCVEDTQKCVNYILGFFRCYWSSCHNDIELIDIVDDLIYSMKHVMTHTQ